MQIVSTKHLAEILIGIARAQAAIVQSAENDDRILSALEALIADDRKSKALADLPVRLLLASLRRTGPDAAALAQELERLCAGPAQPPSPLDQRPTDFNP